MQKIFSIFSALVLCLVAAFYFLPDKVKADSPVLSNLVIAEVQTGGCDAYDSLNPDKCIDEDGKAEFIELYNPLNQDLDITDWEIDYVSSSGKTTTPLFVFDGKALADSYILLAHEGYYGDIADGVFGSGDTKTSGLLAKSGGHIQIKNDLGQIVDLMGWGDAEPIGSWPTVAEILPDFSVKRILTGDPLFGTGLIFNAPTKPISQEAGGYLLNNPTDNGSGDENNDSNDSGGDQTGSGGQGAGPASSCDGLIINELLVNPAGSDTGHEFIELYNPTEDFIPLLGCKLQTSANSKIYEFSEGQIEPDEIQAFYNDETGLTLENSGGGSVYMIDTDGSEIYQADYPADIADDVSWSLIDGAWNQTYSVTPNGANELLENKPCPSGQIRNPESDRCIDVVVEAAGLTACPAGKERNPATNRCRNIVSLASTLKACVAGQERNPATNRCRKINDSNSTLAPCKPGQERNPQTHRCRKSSASSSGALKDVKDVLSDTTNSSGNNWLVGGLAISGALLYAFWEWRNEILEKLDILKSKLGKISP